MSLIRIADILFTGEKKLERKSRHCRSLYAEAIEVFMKPATFRLLEVDEEKIIGRIKNIVQQCCRFFRSESQGGHSGHLCSVGGAAGEIF